MKNNNYAPAPFWFLNHHLEADELRRQLQLMKESGVSGFFIHPRAGLLTPYGSKEWFESVRLIVEEADKLGLKAWLYDEDPFPSGAAGGIIMMENPAHCARSLCCKIVDTNENGEYEADLGECQLLTAFTYRPLPDGKVADIEDITDELGVLRQLYHKTEWRSPYYCDWMADVVYPHERAETMYPHMVLRTQAKAGHKAAIIYIVQAVTGSTYYKIPDCLNPKVVERFMELTHEKYKEYLGEYFGTTIPGIFTDEPFLGGDSPYTRALPYTEALAETFYSMHGYEFEPNMYQLWLGTDEECHRFRRGYWATVKHLYRTNFFEPISNWCRKNNLQLVGHVSGEEDPTWHPASGGAYANMKYMDTPGVDILTQNLGNRKRPSLLFGTHSISSAARQLGRERVLCEAMACNPYSYGPRDMRRVTNWLYSQGVNWIVPHGFYYSYDGCRKHDAGKSFFFQDEFFEEFPKYATYADRMGGRLATGKPVGVTALLQLSNRIEGYQPAESEKAIELRTELFRAVGALSERHIEYENISEETLAGGSIADGAVTVGCRRYTQVLIPCEETYTTPLIEKMKSAGVMLFFGQNGCFDWQAIEEHAVHTVLTGDGAEDVLVNRQQYDNGTEIFLFNNREEPAHLHMENEKKWALWNADEDNYYRPVWPLEMDGYGACLLVEMPEDEVNGLPILEHHAVFFAPLYQEWVYSPKEALVTISEWNIEIETALGQMRQEEHRFCRMRDIIGTEYRYLIDGIEKPIFDRAPQVASPYPVKAVFSTNVIMSATDNNKKYLLIEGSTLKGDWQLEINGHPLTAQDFKPCNVYDFTNLATDVTAWLHQGENTLAVRWEKAEEFDGLESAMYIVSNPLN